MCPKCRSFLTKKNGKPRGLQWYRCGECGHSFQSKSKGEKKKTNTLWHDYVWGRQTVTQLATRENRSIQWIRNQLDMVKLKTQTLVPQSTIIIADTTFWGKHYGVTVFRSPTLKRNLLCMEVESEKQAIYYYGRKILEEKEWTFTGAVVDGRRGLATVFKDIPTQICIFHQMKRVTKYLTRKPQTLAGQELRAIMLKLPKSNEREFTRFLKNWHKRWRGFINEKTHLLGTKRFYYTHKKVRSAYISLKTNLPHLFTYKKYPELNIPSTTNSLEGMFSQLKTRIAVHRGLRKDRRFKVISEVLEGENVA